MLNTNTQAPSRPCQVAPTSGPLHGLLAIFPRVPLSLVLLRGPGWKGFPDCRSEQHTITLPILTSVPPTPLALVLPVSPCVCWRLLKGCKQDPGLLRAICALTAPQGLVFLHSIPSSESWIQTWGLPVAAATNHHKPGGCRPPDSSHCPVSTGFGQGGAGLVPLGLQGRICSLPLPAPVDAHTPSSRPFLSPQPADWRLPISFPW